MKNYFKYKFNSMASPQYTMLLWLLTGHKKRFKPHWLITLAIILYNEEASSATFLPR